MAIVPRFWILSQSDLESSAVGDGKVSFGHLFFRLLLGYVVAIASFYICQADLPSTFAKSLLNLHSSANCNRFYSALRLIKTQKHF
jgi:hypothetical protein